MRKEEKGRKGQLRRLCWLLAVLLLAAFAAGAASEDSEGIRMDALVLILAKDAAATLFQRMDRDKALKLTVCGEAKLYIVPKDGSDDLVMIQLETGGNTFRVRADGGNLWKNLLDCCLRGTYHDDNLPLD